MNTKETTFKLSLDSRLLSTAFAVALAVTSSVMGQTTSGTGDAPDDTKDATVKMAPFSVTGTNIDRIETENVLPVTTISPDMVMAINPSEPSQVLNAMPFMDGTFTNETSQTGGSSSRGDMTAVELRGLGVQNTLVLLDGYRFAPYPISITDSLPGSGSSVFLGPNTNVLPLAALDHVDVLRDGASPIYGSDAVAGVVNWITKINFQGAELNFHYGDYQHGGEETSVTALLGGKFDGNRGRYVLEFDNYHREYIALGTRPYLSDADVSSRAPVPFNGEAGQQQADFSDRFWITDYVEFTTQASNGGFPYANNFWLAPNGSGGVSILNTPPSHTGPQSAFYGNQNLIFPLMPRTDRDTLYARAEYDLNSKMTAFTELNLHRAENTQYRNALPYFGMFIPASNPFNPYGTNFFDPNGAPTASGSPRLVGTPQNVLIEQQTLGDISGNQADQTYDTEWRALAGLRGKLSDNWNWEAVALYSRSTVTDSDQGYLYQPLSKIITNGIYNPFGWDFAVQNGSLVVTSKATNPTNSLDSAYAPFIRWGYASLADFSFKTSGTLFQVKGNPISLALGAEVHHDEADNNQPANVTGNSFLDYGRTVDVNAARTVGGEFAELFAPVITPNNKIPFVTELDLDAAARTEEYSDVGNSGVKPKFGIAWKPTQWALLRASYNEGFVAPGLQAINQRASTGGTQQNPDPYSFQETPLYRNTVTGNHNLKPAHSEGKSAGVVVQMPHVKGLSFSFDHWEISERDVVISPSSLSDDAALLEAASQKALAAGTPLTSINLGSGTTAYQGSPLVVRNPVTSVDIAYFAQLNAGLPSNQQRAVVGTIASTFTESINRADELFRGDDINITYETPEYSMGRFLLTSDWTYMETAQAQDEPGQPIQEGLYNGEDPRWQGLTTLTWKKDGWEVGVSDQYIGRLYDPNAVLTGEAQYDALGKPSYIGVQTSNGMQNYHYIVHDTSDYNAHIAYTFKRCRYRALENLRVQLAVNNVLDRQAPLASNNTVQSGGAPFLENIYGQSLAPGRFFSIDLQKKF